MVQFYFRLNGVVEFFFPVRCREFHRPFPNTGSGGENLNGKIDRNGLGQELENMA